MDFSGSESYEDTNDGKLREKPGCFFRFFRFIFISAAVVIFAVGGIAFFLTTDLGRLWVLNKVNRGIAPAHLAVDDWDAGFFGSAKLSGVKYVSPEDGLTVDIKRVVFSKGVFAFIPIGKLALGELTLESPVITYDSPEAAEKTSASEPQADEEGGFFLPVADFGGRLFVKDGIVIVKEGGKPLFQSKNIKGHLLVDSFWRPFGFEVHGRVGNGTLGLTADLQSINSLINGADSEHDDKVVLQLAGVNLATLTPVLEMAGSPVLPHAGTAQGALTVERSRNGSVLGIQGGMLIDKMQLVTGDDEYSPAGDVALLIDSEIRDDLCLFRKFEFSSPWGKAKLNGTLRHVEDNRRVTGDIDGDVDFDLAALTRDFRYALQMDDELAVKRGRLTGVFKIDGSQGDLNIDSSLKVTGLTMQYKGRVVNLTRDPSLTLKAHLPADKFPVVEELRLRTSFADIYGKGSINQGVLKGYVDLTRFSEDFKGLLKDGVVLGGAAHFDFSTKPEGESVGFNLMTKFSRLNITSGKGGVSSLKSGSFDCDGLVAGAEGAGSLQDLVFQDVDYDLRLNASRVHGVTKRFVPIQKNESLPVLRGFTLVSELKVPDAVGAFGAFMTRKAYQEAAGWKGSIPVNAALESANGVAKMRINGAGRDLVLKAGGITVNEPDLQLSGAATFDSAENSLSLNEVVVSSDAVNIKVPEWYVHVPEQGGNIDFKGKADAVMDVSKIYPLLFSSSKNYDQVRGDLSLSVDAASASSSAKLRLNGVLSDMYLLLDGNILYYEKRAELKSLFALRGDDVLVESFELYSSLADVTADGRIRDFRKSRIADLDGTLDFKFDTLDRLLRVRGIDEWKITGHKKASFKLNGPLTADFMRSGRFSGEAYLASLNGLGLSAGGAPLSLELSGGRLTCDWRPVLNGGRLRLTPLFDFTPQGTVISMPAGTVLLEKVAITQEMVDKLLVNFNPMFNGSRLHQGTVNLVVNSLRSGPEPGYEDLSIDADAEFNDLKMTLSPAMRQMLNMIQVKDSIYQVKNLPIHSVVRKERVYVDPVTMVFADQPLTFSGSVGFDSTIKYLIEVPLSEPIAAKSGLKFPKGLSVKVPVTGTVDNPRIDTGALENTVGGFIKNTLGDDALKSVSGFLEQLKKDLQ